MPRINPYTVPDHGWRGLGLPGNHKRKWYTVLHNDQLLVTALLLMPGEHSVRHSHETGELSIRYSDEMRPEVSWNPPGVLHGGAPPPQSLLGDTTQSLLSEDMITQVGGNPELANLINQVLQQHMERVEEAVATRLRPQPSPRVIIDVLFPPFRTTVDDPGVAEPKTVTSQWFD